METAKRLLQQFWLPIVIASVWTAYNLGLSLSTWSVTLAIAHFSASFFFSSWATSQFFRVRNQAAVENNLNALQNRVVTLLDRLDQTTSELIAYIMGGDSYALVMIYPFRDGTANVFVENKGKYPIYDLSIRITDLDELDRTPKQAGKGEHTFRKQTLPPEQTHFLGQISLAPLEPIYGFNIFTYARNGYRTQCLRMAHINGRWLRAQRIQGRYPDDTVILETSDHPLLQKQLNEVNWRSHLFRAELESNGLTNPELPPAGTSSYDSHLAA